MDFIATDKSHTLITVPMTNTMSALTFVKPLDILSVWLLSVAMKSIPMGTAYAVWTGIGAVGGVIVGIIMFGEAATLLRLASAALIVIGIAGLKLSAH